MDQPEASYARAIDSIFLPSLKIGGLAATRSAVLQAWEADKVTTNDRVSASTLAGAFTGGSVGYLTRGRANILPGMVMLSAAGFLGQKAYDSVKANKADALAQEAPIEKPNIWQRLAESKWTPVKFISDDEYEKMLKEKLLRLEAEIALIDEDIEKLQQSGKEQRPKE
ncbi:MAG: hypothetical protein M1820_002005 [Bogoriella megaspora]|nr:MAG: hypothetical protein M1820_002005 [Bogoriella megaspora]